MDDAHTSPRVSRCGSLPGIEARGSVAARRRTVAWVLYGGCPVIVDLSLPCTQARLGDLVGVSQQAISALQGDGRLPADGTLGEMLLAYCHRLREQAAGRIGHEAGGLDLAQERAALARAQREGIEIRNATLRGDYAAVQLLGEVLANASQAVAERFEHLDGQLTKACPELTDSQRRVIQGVIAAARNDWVRGTVELVSSRITAGDDDLPDAAADADDEPRAD